MSCATATECRLDQGIRHHDRRPDRQHGGLTVTLKSTLRSDCSSVTGRSTLPGVGAAHRNAPLSIGGVASSLCAFTGCNLSERSAEERDRETFTDVSVVHFTLSHRALCDHRLRFRRVACRVPARPESSARSGTRCTHLREIVSGSKSGGKPRFGRQRSRGQCVICRRVCAGRWLQRWRSPSGVSATTVTAHATDEQLGFVVHHSRITLPCVDDRV